MVNLEIQVVCGCGAQASENTKGDAAFDDHRFICQVKMGAVHFFAPIACLSTRRTCYFLTRMLISRLELLSCAKKCITPGKNGSLFMI
jgi:hypothetical protein